MDLHRRLLTILLSLALIPSAALISRAQDQDQTNDDYAGAQAADVPGPQATQDDANTPDPPARAARLQYMTGSVSVQPHGTDDWVAGQLNRPLTNADNIWADKNSKAEISVGTGLIRIGSESSLTLTNIDENTVQLQLHQGELNLHVRRLYDNEKYEVDTPNQAFTVDKPGDYRFDVDSDADSTVITVWRGEGESTGEGPAVRIREGQQARFADGTNTEDAELHSAPSPDTFDQWARSRDERLDRSASAKYVSPDVPGYEDLDEYGNWRETSEYGPVWVPTGVDAGWAPYRYGHWIWVDPWGWTWVEDEPWGYAPFHYGRWVYWDNYWAWAPGPIYVRPYYAPALVAWFGGPGWGVSVGFGGGFGYGWCPLGWGEPYIPWYGVSHGYFNQVNITNTHITNINNYYNNNYGHRPGVFGGVGGGLHNNIRYANMHSPNGFTAVSRNTLLNSQSVARNAIRVSPNQMSRISPVRSLGVRPTRTSMLGPNAGRTAAAPPPRSFSRPTVSRMSTPSAMRGNASANVSARGGFGSRAGSMNNGSRPMGNAGMQRPMNMPNRGASPNSNIRMGGSSSTWSRSVPRPPSVGGMNGMRSGMQNGPRSNVSRSPMGSEAGRGAAPSMRPQSVPRPSGSMSPRGYSPAAGRSSFPSASNSRSIPRPSPSYQASNRGYGNGSYSSPYSGSYGRPNGGSYSRPSPSYSRPQPSGGGGGYSRPTPSYGGGSYGRPSPSYGGGSYGRPGGGSYGRPAPSYGGGSVSRSTPSYGGGGHSMPSYGGGGRSMPSYGGGGGSRGGFGGGGGHASAPSGGGGGYHGGGGGGHGGGRR